MSTFIVKVLKVIASEQSQEGEKRGMNYM